MPQDLWQNIASQRQARQLFVVATIIRDSGSVPRRSGAKMLIWPDGRTHDTIGGGAFEAAVVADALETLKSRRSQTRRYAFVPEATSGQSERGARTFGAVCGGEVEVFLESIMPTDQLLIVGGGHCGRALARAATLLDFSIIVADDRPEYSLPEDFPPQAQVLQLSPDFHKLPLLDAQTYVVLVSKGYITDEAALRRVLDSPAVYIGMIGSLRKREAVFEKLRADGIAQEKLARVHAPIGLDIGAQTPEEIAVSILAEIIQVRASANSARPTATI